MIKKCFLVIVLITMFSCEREEVTLNEEVVQEDKIEYSKESLVVVYNGIETTVMTDKNGVIDFSGLDEKISGLLQTADLLRHENKIYLFDEQSMMDAYISKIVSEGSKNNNFSGKRNGDAIFFLSEHDNFRGRNLERTGEFSNSFFTFFNMNDKVSSFYILNYSTSFCMLELYTDSNFKGRALKVIASPMDVLDYENLHIWNRAFNDTVSSAKGFYL